MNFLSERNAPAFVNNTIYRFMRSTHINWIRFTTILSSSIIKDAVVLLNNADRKTFFCYNEENLPLTEIYKKNKKRRGRSRYLLLVELEVTKDSSSISAKVVYIRNKNN